jgi:predicted nucleic acid-binding protein
VSAARAEVVLDASAGIRAVLGLAPSVLALFAEARVSAPDVFALEAANAFRTFAARGALEPDVAAGALDDLLALPIRARPGRRPRPPGAHAALELEVTVYDAAYVIVARGLEGTLVTSDRRLAATYEPARLVV